MITWYRVTDGTSLGALHVVARSGQAFPITWRSSKLPRTRILGRLDLYYRLSMRSPAPLHWGKSEIGWEFVACSQPEHLTCVVRQLRKFSTPGRTVHALWEVERTIHAGDRIRVMALQAPWWARVEWSAQVAEESPERWHFRGPITAYSHIDDTV